MHKLALSITWKSLEVGLGGVVEILESYGGEKNPSGFRELNKQVCVVVVVAGWWVVGGGGGV